MKKTSKKYFGFTLVELIIVITILAILATIAFVSYSDYILKTKDTTVLSNLNQIEKSLKIYNIKSGTYPNPDKYVSIYNSGELLQKSGVISTNLSSILEIKNILLNSDGNEFMYTVNYNNKLFSSKGDLYNLESLLINNTYADQNLKYSKYIGDKIGILTFSGNNVLNNDVDLSLSNKDNKFVLNIDNNTTLYGSGIELGGGFKLLQDENTTFLPPTNCPDGYIKVPGNLNFLQPGFCVAKYEMKQAVGNAGSWNGSTSFNEGPTGTSNSPYCTKSSQCINTIGTASIISKGSIVSKPEGYPIVWINQYNAISACNNLGKGYHLITNNEWMTVARNLELNNQNWTGSKMYIGQSFGGNGVGTGALPGTTGEYGDITDNSTRRTLYLSNNEVIWDFVGNVWEHVNKSNILSGENYGLTHNSDVSYLNIYSGGWADGWNNSTSIVREKLGPLSQLYGTGNLIGNIYGYNSTAGSLFIRGGSWSNNYNNGIYTIALDRSKSSVSHGVGFRCAYINK